MQPDDLTLLSGLKALIMYDGPEGLDVTKEALSFYKATVVACSRVTEGLERLQTDRPDVILCDLGRYQVNGYQFILAVRNLPPDKGGDTPAVALSVWSREEARTRAFNAGFQKYLCKPVLLATLIGTVAGVAGNQPR